MKQDDLPRKDLDAPAAGGRTKPPGLKEIAAHLNLSPATVSMVMNDVPLAKSLSEETRARVLAAAKQFNYRPNLVARALSKRESRTLGVIAPEASDGYFTRVMRGVEAAMLSAGYLYLTTSHLGRSELIREYPAQLTQRGVDGLIFLNTHIYEHPGVPCVSISGECLLDGVTSILSDQADGMLAGMRHLASMGHERILVMRGSAASLDGDDRYHAILKAAEQLRIAMPEELTLTLETHQLTPEVGYQAVADALRREVKFTAVLAFNDMSALGAMRAMEDVGLLCPRDVSVLGVDDICTAPFMTPRLSTCAQPLEAMGAAAVEHLLARIRMPHAAHQAQVMFPMTLKVRESTGRASVAKEFSARTRTTSPMPVLLHRTPTPAAPQTTSTGE